MSSSARVVAVVAPAGYGKSTVLAQWADRVGDDAVRVTCRPGTDAGGLLAAVVAAAGPADPGTPTVEQAVRTLAAGPARTLLVDEVQALTDPGGLDALTGLVDELPATCRVGLASRSGLPVATARLRVHGELLEIGPDDLVLDVDEAADLLARAGAELDLEALGDLLERTEGWPVALSLAAMALREQSRRPGPHDVFTGDDRFMRDYLRAEVLAGLSLRDTSLLVRCSVLDELTGPLCDAVLPTWSSGADLERLAARGVVLPVDRGGERYRCHPLLRDLLLAELHRREPSIVPHLHRRAATWYAAAGDGGAAIEHAHRSGDKALLAGLVLEWAQRTWAVGRVDRVRRWMTWLEEATDLDTFPAVAVHAALTFALVGDPVRAERWSDLATRAARPGTLPDGSTVEGTLAYLRAIEARAGVARMRADAQEGWEGLSPASPFRATMRHTEGLAALLDGDLDGADALFAEAVDLATASGAEPLAALALCERATVAAAQRRWPAVDALVHDATDLLRGGRYDSYWSSALVHAWAARVALRSGDRDDALAHLGHALALRPLLTHALPVVSTQALVETARALVALGDVQSAASVVRQAEDVVRRRPGLGDLPDRVTAVHTQVREAAASTVLADALTPAEIRLLPLLSTHLTFPGIAERLGVSRNTVKTQAISAYRKLGVSSRSEAVARWETLAARGA
ncbi:LuxR family transcriptional regulator [Cellulomonas chitinilytica]|nr:LuxR family transcriptional regulator [Cellulomonas chitinilytica]